MTHTPDYAAEALAYFKECQDADDDGDYTCMEFDEWTDTVRDAFALNDKEEAIIMRHEDKYYFLDEYHDVYACDGFATIWKEMGKDERSDYLENEAPNTVFVITNRI